MLFKGSLTLALLVASSREVDAFTNTQLKNVGSRTTSFLQPASTSHSVATKTTARGHGYLSLADERAVFSKLNMSGKDVTPEEILPLGKGSVITPEGYGFSSPILRVLNIADRNTGFYRAKASDIVTDVMDEITTGKEDVALVFEDDKLKGIFTETDYIEVCLGCMCDRSCFRDVE